MASEDSQDSQNMELNLEYTLEDTYAALQETIKKKQEELEDLEEAYSNNEASSFRETITAEEFLRKKQIVFQNLLRNIQRDVPSDFPIPGTEDLYVNLFTTFQQEIKDLVRLKERVEDQQKKVDDDIVYLENIISGLIKMKEACSKASEEFENANYTDECVDAMRLFREVKTDLKNVVDALYPDNEHVQDSLAELTRRYFVGGDEAYMDINPEILTFIKFMVKIGAAAYHRNDKNKVRLMDL